MPRPIDPNAVFTAADIAETLNLELLTARRLMADGEIRCRRPGKARLATGASILDYLNAETARDDAEAEAEPKPEPTTAEARAEQQLADQVRDAIATTRNHVAAAEALNALGVLSPTGTQWTKDKLRHYLKSHPEAKPNRLSTGGQP